MFVQFLVVLNHVQGYNSVNFILSTNIGGAVTFYSFVVYMYICCRLVYNIHILIYIILYNEKHTKKCIPQKHEKNISQKT